MSNEGLHQMIHGRPCTEAEAAMLAQYPDKRGVGSRDVAAWLPVVITMGVMQVCAGAADGDPTRLRDVVLFYPGNQDKLIKAGIGEVLDALFKRRRGEDSVAKIKALFARMGLSYRPGFEAPSYPWVAVGYLATDPLPRWLKAGLADPGTP